MSNVLSRFSPSIRCYATNNGVTLTLQDESIVSSNFTGTINFSHELLKFIPNKTPWDAKVESIYEKIIHDRKNWGGHTTENSRATDKGITRIHDVIVKGNKISLGTSSFVSKAAIDAATLNISFRYITKAMYHI